MFVCLCYEVTHHDVTKAVANGACTSKQVATVCGAGSDCGRCRRIVREIIAAGKLCRVADVSRLPSHSPRSKTSRVTIERQVSRAQSRGGQHPR
jgi:bacterioferritin-associated ferredoxin